MQDTEREVISKNFKEVDALPYSAVPVLEYKSKGDSEKLQNLIIYRDKGNKCGEWYMSVTYKTLFLGEPVKVYLYRSTTFAIRHIMWWFFDKSDYLKFFPKYRQSDYKDLTGKRRMIDLFQQIDTHLGVSPRAKTLLCTKFHIESAKTALEHPLK